MELNMVATTPASKYPTERGSEVDSRKIVAGGAGRDHLTAVRLKHIVFASEELATQSLQQLRSAQTNFDDLAVQISACVETRDKGGEIGWISINRSNEHVDLILPEEARNVVLESSTKPGDIVMAQSERGHQRFVENIRHFLCHFPIARRLAGLREPCGEASLLREDTTGNPGREPPAICYLWGKFW